MKQKIEESEEDCISNVWISPDNDLMYYYTTTPSEKGYVAFIKVNTVTYEEIPKFENKTFRRCSRFLFFKKCTNVTIRVQVPLSQGDIVRINNAGYAIAYKMVADEIKKIIASY